MQTEKVAHPVDITPSGEMQLLHTAQEVEHTTEKGAVGEHIQNVLSVLECQWLARWLLSRLMAFIGSHTR